MLPIFVWYHVTSILKIWWISVDKCFDNRQAFLQKNRKKSVSVRGWFPIVPRLMVDLSSAFPENPYFSRNVPNRYCGDNDDQIRLCVYVCTSRPKCVNSSPPRQNDRHLWQTTFSNAFSWMKMIEFRIKFHWNLLPGVQLTIKQHWFW